VTAPRIPDEELAARPGLLGHALADAGFDGWLAYGDDRAVAGPDHVRYLSDLEPHFEPVLIAGRVDDSNALVLTGPETVGYAAVRTARAGVGEIVAIEEFAHPDEEYPTIAIASGLETLRERFAGCRRIALLGGGALPHELWRRAIDPLGETGLEVSAADAVAYTLRAVKTAAEQAVTDEAYRIARLGLEAAARSLRPGVSEREVAAEAEAAMRRAGAEGFGIDTMVAAGIANTAPILARSTFREIAADDLVCVTLAPRYEGYHAALARAFLFRRDAGLEAAIDVAREGQRAALELLVAGREGRDAARALRETVEHAGTGAEVPYVPVHSIGVIEFEPPIFLSSSAATIQAGMALSIDSPLFHAPWGGLRLEDGFSISVGGEAVPRFADYEDIVPVLVKTSGCSRAAVPSMLILGRQASSQRGSRHVSGPSSSSVAGSSMQRTTSASRKTATARPKPNSLSVRSSPSVNERKTQTMIAAAAVITRPVSATASPTAADASRWRTHCSRTREIRNTS
jgi:Xaa-Pro aminopeptidase